MCLKVIKLVLLLFAFTYGDDSPCRPQSFGQDSIVCVCDGDYCDSFDPELPDPGHFIQIESNKAGERFAKKFGAITNYTSDTERTCSCNSRNPTVYLSLDKTKTAQRIIGFGGSFTDAVGYNLNKLNKSVVDRIFSAYYGKNGLRYNMGRTPVGLSDFSVNQYFYDDTPYDLNMTDWKLRREDFEYKIPYIKRAKDMIEDDLLLLSSVWTVPQWMRAIADSGIRTKVNSTYFASYCLYIMKFLEAYKKEGIQFYAVSYVNEPTLNIGLQFLPQIDEVMTTWTLEQMIDFAAEHFLPALKKSFPDTKMLFFDDNREVIVPVWLKSVTRRPKYLEFYKNLELVGFHSYSDSIITPDCLDNFHSLFPNATIMSTEMCIGRKGKFGVWADAEFYVESLLQELNHHTSAFIDWNLLLDMDSGPSFMNTNKTAAIIVDTENNIFYKQPSFYAMGHFSKFMPRGSVKVEVRSQFLTELEYAAVMRPDGYIAAVLYNKKDSSVSVEINDDGREIPVILSPNSINTVIFK